MKLAIMQPYFFPYIGYFKLLHAVEKFVFYDDVNFIKGGWINRNRLLLGGKVGYFTVPLSQAGSFSKINSIQIKSDMPWEARIFAQISGVYSKAPYYEPVMSLVKNVLETHDGRISTLAKNSVLKVAEYLSLEKSFTMSSEVYGNQDQKSVARVLDICRQESATSYVNLPGGRDLYAEEDFLKAGIHLEFVSVRMPVYRQSIAGFHPGLSIIDVLMFNSPQQVVAMMADEGEQ